MGTRGGGSTWGPGAESRMTGEWVEDPDNARSSERQL